MGTDMNVAIVAYEGCWAMGVFSATDFFRIVSLLETHLNLKTSFAVDIVSVDGAEVLSASGHAIKPDTGISQLTDYDLIIIPATEGPRVIEPQAPDPRLVDWLSAHLRRKSLVLAFTTGAGLLAATGLVDEVLMATHWAFIGPLKKRYPACNFVSHKSFLQSNGIYTTGSLNGGFDALLGIIAQSHGDSFSQLCATHLLVSDPRNLNPILPGYRNHIDEVILRVQDCLEAHYTEAVTIQNLAAGSGLSERSLARRFRNATGITPVEYLQQVRIDKAKKLLISTSMAVNSVAYEVGYENVGYFIRLFKGATGKTPAKWRGSHR